MKRLSVFLFCLWNFCYLNGQETAKVQVISRVLENKILLRWAVDQPYEWQQANDFGFLVERITLIRNGEAVLPMERVMLTPEPLKPKPLQEWEDLATTNQNAAVVAQALYGESFEVDVPGSAKGQIMAVNKELEQRFTFALVAVDQSFETAKLAGWGLEDATVKKGDSYLYKIKVALPTESEINIAEGAIDANIDNYRPLPKPIGLVAVFDDKSALLNWDFASLQKSYISYFVERSEDNINFSQLNGKPLFQADKDNKQSEASIFYTDSIVNNKKYYYRVKGISSFGEIGPPSDVIEGMGSDALKYTPRIYKKEIPDDNTAILYWEFPEKANEQINSFELRRSNKPDGDYETVLANIPPTTRMTTYAKLKRINYFTIVAKAKNNTESVSYAAIVQPVDSIPPSPPTGLKGIADTMGIIKLDWIQNMEEDLAGYRVFRGTDLAIEFSELTNSDIFKNTFADTLNIGLNKKVFYKIKAMDQRYNASSFSEIIEIKLPQVIPPSPPVIRKYKVMNDSIQIYWTPSSSEAVVEHHIYRKKLEKLESPWELLKIIESDNVQSYIDIDNKENGIYSYTVLAKSNAGLESNPSESVQVNYSGNSLDNKISKFSALPNRELRFITLTWKAKNMNVLEYSLYRGEKGEGLKLFKTFQGETSSYTDYELNINTQYTYGIQAISKIGEQSPIRKIDVIY